VLQKAPAGIAVKPAGTAPDIDPGQPETAVSAGLTQRMAGETQAGGADVVASSAISDTTERIQGLIKEYRWSEARTLAADLEKQLGFLPRKGSQVREGWILLAQVEGQRLRSEKQVGRVVDVSRLRALRQEAENVVD